MLVTAKMYVNQLTANSSVLAASMSTTWRERIAAFRSPQRPSAVITRANSTNDHSTRCANTSKGETSATNLKYSGISPHRPYDKMP